MTLLVLVGLRGSGKTSAGRRAAQRLGVPFHDVDEEVERRAGMSVAQLFAGPGEAAFRRAEREATLVLLAGEGVLATGGGCVLDEQVRAALRAGGSSLWLTAPAEVLARRIRGSGRPSLTGAPPEDELEGLRRHREPLYRSCARWTVDTGPLALEGVADVIQYLWASLPGDQLR